MSSEKQSETNRGNAERDTASRPAEAKARAKRVSVKEKMEALTAQFLPDEKSAAYQQLLATWRADYQPVGEWEEYLVRQIVSIVWRLDRAEHHEWAMLSARVDEAMAQGRRDFLTRLGTTAERLLPKAAQVAQFGLDRADAADLLAEVTSSTEGCRWLIVTWRGLRESAQCGRAWSAEQELHATRMLGQGPGPIVDEVALDLVFANRIATDPDIAMTPAGFDGLSRLTTDPEMILAAYERRPVSEIDAFMFLMRVSDAAIAQLEEILQVLERDGDAEADAVKQAGTLSSFDPSDEAERFRRHVSSLRREFHRTIDAMMKQQADRVRRAKDPISAKIRQMAQARDNEFRREGRAQEGEAGQESGREQTPVPHDSRQEIQEEVLHEGEGQDQEVGQESRIPEGVIKALPDEDEGPTGANPAAPVVPYRSRRERRREALARQARKKPPRR